jgi:hypothetical protein
MFERKLRKTVRNIVENEYIKDQSIYDIVGKKMGDIFPNNPGINKIRNKIITYAKFFEGGEEFKGYYSSKEYLRMEGYESGSMMRDYPIPFMKMGKTNVDNRGNTIIITKYEEERPLIITKYDALSQESFDELDGVIIPSPDQNSMRDGNIYVVFFNFPD